MGNGTWKHRTLAYKMAATVQLQHTATHNTVAYTVAVTVQHEQLYDTRQPRTLACTMAATVRHAALWLELYNMKQLYGMQQHGGSDT